MMKRTNVAISIALAFGLSPAAGGCVNDLDPSPTPKALSAEAYCATIPSAGYGHYFFCATTQANLQDFNILDGSHGFCQSAASNNLGLVGYAAYTFSGLALPVESQSAASARCASFGSACPGYLTCTRQ